MSTSSFVCSISSVVTMTLSVSFVAAFGRQYHLFTSYRPIAYFRIYLMPLTKACVRHEKRHRGSISRMRQAAILSEQDSAILDFFIIACVRCILEIACWLYS